MNLDTTRFKVDYSVIKLQDGSGDTLLGSISKIAATNENLYVLSNGGVYIFRTDGTFLKKLQQGRGPKEFLRASDILVDVENGQLEILSGLKIYIYKLDGQYLSSLDLPIARTYFEFAKIKDSYLLYSPVITGQNTCYFNLYTPQTGNIKSFVNGECFKDITISTRAFHVFQAGKDSLYMTGMYGNKLYSINSKLECDTVLIFKNCVDENSKIEYDSAMKRNVFAEDYKYSALGNINYICDTLMAMTIIDRKSHHVIYDIKNQVAYKDAFGDVKGGLLYSGSDATSLYYSIEASYIDYFSKQPALSPIGKRMAKELQYIINGNEETNPVIIKVKYEVSDV